MRFTENDITSLESSDFTINNINIMDVKNKTINNTFHLQCGQKFTEEEIQIISNLLKNKPFHVCCSGNGIMLDYKEQ